MSAARAESTAVVAVDKFKGSASALEACAALAEGLAEAGLRVRVAPIADGGEGTVDAAVSAGHARVERRVRGPLGEPVEASFAWLAAPGVAIVEAAQACGLDLVPQVDGDSGMRASTRGVGELIRHCLDLGARTVVIGAGGSASTDGGAGLLRGLGARILDDRGAPVGEGARGLLDAAAVDLRGLDPRLAETELVLAADVDNPLCGPSGAARVYGPQKGLAPPEAAAADAALGRFAELVEDVLRVERGAHALARGSGAAGGLGFGLLAACSARLESGAGMVLDLVGLESALDGADLVVTGEGRLDRQTLHGKGPAAVIALARERGLPVYAVCGRSELGAEELGATRVLELVELEPDVRRCIERPLPLLRELGRIIARDRRSRAG
ncbi:glycerate kinase [Gulosibacter sp. 10]|uniref:glycerate kinase family protein n=1 Tax=Gulosibacter sp. 10 TaxID=1255570 RepID=UPI00097EB8E5|nr:glycerate kinase [Gulosibacter sp. 10]SJM70928.1 Glycerate kinase [Gulosibacter sp. 10]